jgi:nitrite reductase/ring-hydroxylating ferredoxin subunit
MSEQKLPSGQPWEIDFPISRVEAEHVTRREFAKFLVLISGGMCAGTAWVAVKDKLFPPHVISKEEKICGLSEVPVGGMLAFTLAGSKIPYILIHVAESEWRAFEQKCTHLSCAVYYDPKLGKIVCPCHKGFFDARTGMVLEGPPPRALGSLPIEVRGDEVYVVPEKDNQHSTA